jgi:hypothetical protein
MTHVVNLPPLLSQISVNFSRTSSRAVDIDTRFGGTTVKSSVRGKLFAHIIDGYNGPANARVVRTFLPGPPSPTTTPVPLIIKPSTGTVYLTSNGQTKATSIGVRSGFGYIEESVTDEADVEALDIRGVLTGSVIVNANSGVQSIDAIDLQRTAIAKAANAGFFFTSTRTTIAQNTALGSATLTAAIPASTPASIAPGSTFLYSAQVEKWRFGIYVQTLTYITLFA